MMSRKVSAAASTMRIAPTPSRVQARVGATAPRLGPPGARAVKEKSLLHERLEVDRSVAQGPPQGPESDRTDDGHPAGPRGRSNNSRLVSIGVGLALVAIALLVYSSTKPFRFYDHFEWQAEAFLEGQTAIRYPVEASADSPGNAFFNDVRQVPSNDGVPRGDIPFPPLPAVLLLPFVAAWGHAADGQFIFAVVGAIDVGIAWWVLGALPIRRWVRLATTIFVGFGTVLWYAAQIGTTWYQAHVLAVGLALLAVGVALRADRAATAGLDDAADTEPAKPPPVRTRLMAALAGLGIDRRQVLAGLLFGLACTSRLTVLFAAPFFLFVGGGGSWIRRGVSAGLGAAIPVGALLLYNLASTGQLFHPGYQFLYEQEAGFYTALGYNLSWGIEDPRYLPHNLGIMLFSTPAFWPDIYPAGLGGGQALCVDPAAVRGLFDPACPIALPRDTGMSLIPHEPGLPPRAAQHPPPCPEPPRCRRRPCRAHRRVRQRHALQPGLGPVRLPLQSRLRAVGNAARGARDGAPPDPGGNRGRGRARRAVDRRQPLGSRLGQRAGMVMGLRLARLAPIGVGLIAVALAAWRLMPGVGFWDTAEFQTVPPILGTAHPTGYPTYVILGWLSSIALGPAGDAAFRMNLLSAIVVGVAAAITVDLVRLLTGSTILGAAAGLGLATTEIVWAIGTHADPHALHLALLAGLLWLLVRWEMAHHDDPLRADRWLVAAAAVTGLSIGNHSLTLLLALPIVLYVLAVEPGILARGRLVATCAVAVAVPTILVYLELPLRGGAIPGLTAQLVYGRPDTLGGFAYVVTGEQFRGGLNDPFGDLPGKLADLFALTARQFGPLAAVIAPAFVVTASRFPAYALMTGTAVFITCFFDAAYVNADIERYYLGPALMAWTWLAVLAMAIVEAVPRATDLRRFAAAALAGLVLLAPTIAAFPGRAQAVDRTADRAAEQWLDSVFAEVEPNAVIVSWWSFSTTLWYGQLIEGQRPDIFVVDDRTRLDQNLGEPTDVIDANLGKRPVYAIRVDSGEVDELRARYDLTPLDSPDATNVFRVLPKAPPIGTGTRP